MLAGVVIKAPEAVSYSIDNFDAFTGLSGLCRPYSLGCIAASSLAFLSLVACFFVMPETHPRFRKHSAAYQLLGRGSSAEEDGHDESSSTEQGRLLFRSACDHICMYSLLL